MATIVRKAYGSDAVEFVTNTRSPRITTNAGQPPIAFDPAIDLQGVPEHLHPWARRWNPVLRHAEKHNPDRRRELSLVTNSRLDEREWAALDREIFEMVKLRRNGVEDLVSRGLTKQTTLAVMLSQWRMASERVRPTVNMDGRSRANRDLTDRITRSVPVPIFRTDYEIGSRELLSSRTLGEPLDTFEAGEAASAIMEEQERLLFLGDAAVVIEGNDIPGYTTLPGRDTATAAAYGGGDFGTISNVLPTVLGMLAALSLVRYHGPFMFYIADAQYHEMLETFTDGSGQTAKARVEELPQILEVKPSDMLTAAEGVMVQMTKNVVDWITAMAIENREWESPDQTALFFAVMAAGAPRLKTDSDGNAGIAHVTAA